MHDRPAPGGEFLQRDLLLRVLADDGRDVADLHFESARVDDREVHLHEARDRATLASKQHVRLAINSHAAPHPIAVPDAERRDDGITWRDPARAVARALALADSSHAQHARPYTHDRPWPHQMLGRRSAEQEDAGPHQIEREL